MIRVHRGRAPAALARNQKQWRKSLARAKTAEQRKLALRRYRHDDIKNALVAAFHGKCAYCESYIRHVDYGHIEHFRPQSKYPAKAFDWTNLLLACGVCNGSAHKGDAFPLKAHGGPLINPCAEEPAQHLSFEYDPVAQLASVRGRTPRGQTTETRLGLNRNDLRAYRSKQLKKLWFIAQRAGQDPEARRLLEEAASPSEPFSAFAAALRAAVASSSQADQD
ncbi:retron system putative HNH endonuclease [Corallococcus sicarius]|uniref:TIGR02646 family protein n=1 Tax=Corallococcus sicarius TaxID=2316726 RepID=A0A3A8MRV9_9BACT|nr:retron system putative HNH endonuclease [Corallococcus sicarius]RKH29464.1 TIGR02646 family protein [Corallococcus sicarius]